jgi:HEPN domain-containing protein
MKNQAAEKDFEEWLRHAEDDYETARTMARRRKRHVPQVVGFHCQQCIEKYLKAVLVFHRRPFPKTHDLVDLLKRCLPFVPVFEIYRRDFGWISGFGVQFRYPGEEPTMEEAKAALAVAKKVREYLRNVLKGGR